MSRAHIGIYPLRTNSERISTKIGIVDHYHQQWTDFILGELYTVGTGEQDMIESTNGRQTDAAT